jgi:uncharacterized protein
MTTTEGARWVCPTCSRPGQQDYRPFCSQRCANRDLGRWLDGSYVLPGGERPGSADTDEE